jgi:hypothetical protein
VHFHQLPLPSLPFAPDELVSRKELAALLQVPVPNIRSWEKRGLMPPRAPALPEGVLTGLPVVLWRGSDLLEWRERMIGVIFQRPLKPRRGMRWVAGTGWVDPPPKPPRDEPVALPKRPRSAPKLVGRELAVLTRLEAQLSALPPDEEPDAPCRHTSNPAPLRRQEPERDPFAGNCVTSRARPARYW